MFINEYLIYTDQVIEQSSFSPLKLSSDGESVNRLFCRTTSGLPSFIGSSSEKYLYNFLVQFPADRTWSQRLSKKNQILKSITKSVYTVPFLCVFYRSFFGGFFCCEGFFFRGGGSFLNGTYYSYIECK